MQVKSSSSHSPLPAAKPAAGTQPTQGSAFGDLLKTAQQAASPAAGASPNPAGS